MEHIAEEYEMKNDFYEKHICSKNIENEKLISNKISDNNDLEEERNGKNSVFSDNTSFSLKNSIITILTSKEYLVK
jgi:hypothetical protein